MCPTQPLNLDPPPDPPPSRLDAAVAAVAGVSRAHAQRLIASGWVKVNGDLAAARDKGRAVGSRDAVVVRPGFDAVVPEPDAPLTVVQRGADWVVVDKPAGQHVHPLQPGETGTLLNAAAARFAQLAGAGTGAESEAHAVGREGGLRRGVVHRLDADTSGAVVLALTGDAWDRLRDAFAQHRVVKTYHALVQGVPDDAGRADLHLAVTRHRGARVSVVAPDHPGARATGLAWRVRARRRGVAWIEVGLETGFLHQIRVACAHLGFAVLGDRTYGQDVAGLAPRQMLHAARIAVDGPDAAAAVVGACGTPPDFARVWAQVD